ncbi:MAG: hypothetical protein DDT34_01897 [Firmicutes bacterium]|nr:hypothetical protein [Bacillota bacterium]MBT9156722.1 hypothetical protein [candidate division NPL-UPA2 bacterium]MBT9157261.1 hypothetical protein [Bacillota bacterium]
MGFFAAMIPLRTGITLTAARLEEEFAAMWPLLPKPISIGTHADQLSLSVGEYDIVAMTMGAPIPWPDLEPICKASLLWPEALSDLRNHADHMVVTVQTQGGPIEKAQFLTQVCACILSACSEQALGVFWLNATLLVPAQIFLDTTLKVMSEALPLYIWIDFQTGIDAQGKVSGFTNGMEALGHLELEATDVPEPAEKLWTRLYDIAEYILENGAVIADGDTVGNNNSERIQVVYGPSLYGRRGDVMRLEYQQLSRRKPPFWKR